MRFPRFRISVLNRAFLVGFYWQRYSREFHVIVGPVMLELY
jgi:hypothetical protein